MQDFSWKIHLNRINSPFREPTPRRRNCRVQHLREIQDSTLIGNDKSLYWNGNQLLQNPIRINSVRQIDRLSRVRQRRTYARGPAPLWSQIGANGPMSCLLLLLLHLQASRIAERLQIPPPQTPSPNRHTSDFFAHDFFAHCFFTSNNNIIIINTSGKHMSSLTLDLKNN